jgi:ABC-type transport system involved in multi-copper enzyme maturation permease subunit
VLRKTPAAQRPFFSPVGRWPVFWREIHGPLVKGLLPFALMFVFVLFATVYVTFFLNTLDESRTAPHVVVVSILLGAGLFMSLVLAASTLASQRQARSLGVLLTTPISTFVILRDTVLAVLWRTRVIWMILLGHLALFSLLGHLHPLVIVHMLMIIAGSSLLVVGLGLFISSRVRSPMLSILTTLVLFVLVWIVVPATSGRIVAVIGQLTDTPTHMVTAHLGTPLQTNPFLLTGVAIDGAPGHRSGDYDKFINFKFVGGLTRSVDTPPTLVYNFLIRGNHLNAAGPFTVHLAAITAMLAAIGTVFLLPTARRLRTLA